MEDYYKILGIQYNASITDISNSFNLKMIDYKLAMGFFWLIGGMIVLGGAILVYSLKRTTKNKK
jgi:hypothetical protein